MKGKKWTYFLLILVAVIWYRAFFLIKGNLLNEDIQIVSPNVADKTFSPVVRDTFLLLANYKDPFGESKSGKRSLLNTTFNNNNNKRPPIKSNIKPVSVFKWPSVKYYGMVKKTASKKALAIVTIDGIQLMGRSGQELFDGFFLKEILRDSVLISNKNRRKYFLRN
tara:strand:- start:11613 stop:12110 length:498 start_codon:yes stop_codon:yes gene_type:complete